MKSKKGTGVKFLFISIALFLVVTIQFMSNKNSIAGNYLEEKQVNASESNKVSNTGNELVSLKENKERVTYQIDILTAEREKLKETRTYFEELIKKSDDSVPELATNKMQLLIAELIKEIDLKGEQLEELNIELQKTE